MWLVSIKIERIEGLSIFLTGLAVSFLIMRLVTLQTVNHVGYTAINPTWFMDIKIRKELRK